MFYGQEREDWEFAQGADTEFRNAFAVSRMQASVPDERAEVNRLAAAGFWVAVMTSEVCCPVTDGLIGIGLTVYASAHSLDAILDRIGGRERDYLYLVAPEKV